MKSEIEQILQQYVDVYGFVDVSTYKQERNKLHKDDLYSDYHFLEDYRTIITLSIPYPKRETRWKGKGFGILSRYSYGTDYHIVFRDILEKIVNDLKSLGIAAKASVDTGGVDERFAGYLSSMGCLGKNQFLIVKPYGTYSFLATILIDVDIETTIQIQDDCGTCTACISACPSGALDHGFDQNKCISHISQEKIPLSDTEIRHFKTMIYGCDICMKVCPKNRGIDIHKYPEFEPAGIENINIKELLRMSNKEYMDRYKSNASSWRGASVIKRNALCLIANQRLLDYQDEIKKSMEQLADNVWYNKTAKRVLEILNEE
jgi:epoxyqueuosine reductase